MKRISAFIIAFVMIFATLNISPAMAAGNFECGEGAGGTSVCAQTFVHRSVVNRRVWVVRLDIFSSGDNSTLEGGSCADNPAVDIKELSIKNASGGRIWGPKNGNLCKANGYSRTYKIDNLRVRCNKAYVYTEYVSRNNFGLDKHRFMAFHVETC